MPRIFAGARVALGVGFMVIVGAEMIGTIRGLGALIMEARTFYRTDITMVGMFVLGALGLAIAVGLERLEARLHAVAGSAKAMAAMTSGRNEARRNP